MRDKGGSYEKLCAYNERREVNLTFSLANFVHLIQKLRSNFLNLISSASESRKKNPPDITLDLPLFFRYKRITSLKNLPYPAPNKSCRTGFKATLRLCLL